MTDQDIEFMEWASEQFQSNPSDECTQSCPDGELLWQASSGELGLKDTQAIVDHLLRCSHCAALWRSAVRTQGQLSPRIDDSPSTLPLQQPEPASMLELRNPRHAMGSWGATQSTPVCAANLPEQTPETRTKTQVSRCWYIASASLAAVAAIVFYVNTPTNSRNDSLRGETSPQNNDTQKHRFHQQRFSWPAQARAEHYKLHLLDETLTPIIPTLNLRRPEFQLPPEVSRKLAPHTHFYWSITTVDRYGHRTTSPTFRVSYDTDE